MVCVRTARESKPGRRGCSISEESIYARTNPRGAGMHPAAVEAAPRFAGEGGGEGGEAPLAVFYGSIAAPCHHLPAPTGIRLPSSASPAATGSQAANRLVEN